MLFNFNILDGFKIYDKLFLNRLADSLGIKLLKFYTNNSKICPRGDAQYE